MTGVRVRGAIKTWSLSLTSIESLLSLGIRMAGISIEGAFKELILYGDVMPCTKEI